MAPMNQMLFLPEYDGFRSRVTAESKKRRMLAAMLPAESQVVIMDRCHVADDYRNSLVTSLIHRRGYRVVYVKIIK